MQTNKVPVQNLIVSIENVTDETDNPELNHRLKHTNKKYLK